jgi:arylsulfatase A-like enzyme
MDPSVPGGVSDYHETPHLEALAAEGTRFSAGYSPSPVCAPSRISIETGLSPASLRVTHINGAELPPVRMTIPEIIKAEKPEYGTAHFGKWHEAWGSTPGDHGYEYHNGGLPYPPPGHDPLTNHFLRRWTTTSRSRRGRSTPTRPTRRLPTTSIPAWVAFSASWTSSRSGTRPT